jgi:hypothetical protein
MRSPETYEELAGAHRARAARIADPELKRSLLEIAKNYESMAARMRRIEALSPKER